MSAKLLRTAAGICWLLVGVSSAHASPLIYIVDDRSNIGVIDLATRASSLIGNAGVALTDIALSPSNQLYGIDATSLYSVSESTGIATLIGSLGGIMATGLGFSPDGTLYAAGATGSVNFTYGVNVSTGQATTIEATFFDGLTATGDIAVRNVPFATATIFGTSRLINIGLTGPDFDVGQAFPDAGLNALVVADGVLYGIDGTSIYSFSSTVLSATPTLIGSYSGLGPAVGATNAPISTNAPIPEPSAVSLVGFGLAILALIGRSAHSFRSRSSTVSS